MKKITFERQLWAALICSVAVNFVGWWLDLPSLRATVWLLSALSFVVHPAVPEKWDSHYQGARGRKIVRIGGIVLMLFAGLLLFLDLGF